VEAAAAEAAWQLPRRLAVLALAGEARILAAAHLPARTITESIGELICAVIDDPDGPGRRAELERAVVEAGARGGLGPTVRWDGARLSFDRAQAALELAEADAGVLIAAQERTGELLLRTDPALSADLAADQLAPLDQLSPASRQRLTQTLEVWLAEQGRMGQVAAALGIHPQTARYRVGRLRELFGPALDDPDRRFWLQLALRARPVAGAQTV
jgi:hypothetical protein